MTFTYVQNDSKPPITSIGSTVESPGARLDVVRDYFELTKPEITLLVALSSVGGFVLAPSEFFDTARFAYLLIGVTLTSAGASALNHWVERDRDGTMRRTMNRPLPAGRISSAAARNFGALLLAAGIALLCPLTNPLTGVFALAAALLYLFVYTPLKHRSKWNTLVGTLPGALPALGGWTAATGSIGWGGVAAFSILAAWQMPHFLSLAWMYRKDYERGGHVMLPIADPSGRSTVSQTLFFSVLLVVLSVWPAAMALAGWLYLIAAASLGVWIISAAFVFYRSYHVQDARRVLKVSIYYIPALVLALILDRIMLAGPIAG